MASRRAPRAPNKRPPNSLAQFGLFDVPENLDDIGGSDGDSDLEAELAAIAGGGGAKKPKAKPKAKIIPTADLDRLVADSLKDIPSDEEISDGDDDPDLLNELSELAIEDDDAPLPISEPPRGGQSTPPASAKTQNILTLLQERIEMYKLAEQNAKDSGESGRARRFNRGIKTLNDLFKQAKNGNAIKDDDIPPPVSTAKHPQEETKTPIVPTPPAMIETPEEPSENITEPEPVNENFSEEVNQALIMLNERKNEYKIAALSAKKNGDNETALNYLKVVKQFDKVILALKEGKPVDLSNMPGPPGNSKPNTIIMPQKENEHAQRSVEPTDEEMPEGPPPALITANSAAEALQQRLELYKEQEAAAAEAGNSSKARRMGRIVKQFQQAIKLHSAGKPIPFDELPTPPGYAPIPGAPQPVQAPPEEAPTPPPRKQQPTEPTSEGEKPTLAKTGRSNSVRKMGNQMGTGLASQQLNILLQRQKEFKEAALSAKQKGEIKEAKEYLRCAKGIDPLIDAAKGGLPVELATVPLPPQAKQELDDSFDMINANDCSSEDDGISDIISRLEEQLTSQLKLCISNRDHHKALGDVAGTNRFEHLALTVKQDLDIVKLAKKTTGEPPKFHYETKQFSIVQSCTDLKDNDLELTVVRGISYNVPNHKDIDTYVRFEFPTTEEPIINKTSLIKDTNNPEYNAVYVLPINRTSRACQRIFKRQAVKLEVYSRGGFFTRDSVIGTVSIKLQPLETQTELHNSYDLMDGRKPIGGKLEVKIRVRHPLLTKQVEQITQKWLIIDH